MGENSHILLELSQMIQENDCNLLNFILKYRDINFSKDEIVIFLENLSSKKEYEQYYTISGSGGSNIIKPNITSIAFLYIASLGIPIVKTGSKAITGINGSTDFFKKLNLLNVDIDNEKYHFAYYDGYAVSLWEKHKNLLSINKSFAEYFESNIFHDFKLKSKMTIQLNNITAEVYLKKQMDRAPKKLFVVYNSNEDLELDEIVGGQVFINKENRCRFKNNKRYKPITTLDEVEQINNDLIFGNVQKDFFWYNVLKFEVSLFLYLNEFVPDISKGEELFQKTFEEKRVKQMLKYCGIINF